MSTIPTSVTEDQFDEYIRPYLKVAKRGYECSMPLYKVFNYTLYRLHTGCQWKLIPIDADPLDPEKKELSWQAVYHHWQKWNKAGCFEVIWEQSIKQIQDELDCTHVNFDGSHTIAKKGGKSVIYQHRKRAKTSNILPMTDANGYIIACSDVVAGNHHDCFNLKSQLQIAFKSMKRLGLKLNGTYFNADSAFDTREARKVCFNHGLIPNIDENRRNRKKPKRGRKRLFDAIIYKQRFGSERTFAWIDKFRALRLRDDRKDVNFLGAHHIAFALINLRHLLGALV